MAQHEHARVFHDHEARHLAHVEARTIPEGIDNKDFFIHRAGASVINKVASNKDVFIHRAGGAVNLEAAAKVDDVVTVISQVFVTASKTFSGPAVYVTQTGTVPPPSITTTSQNSYESAKSKQHEGRTKSTASSQAPSASSSQNSYESVKSLQHQGHTSSAVIASSTVANGVVAGTPLTTSRAPSVVKGTPLSATHSSSSQLISEKSHGMTSGAKAGLAFGILAILGLTAGLILFCIRRRKNQLADKGEKLDEKHASQGSFFGGTAAAVDAPAGARRESMKSVHSSSSRTGATAPRLSLRPITSLFPNMLSGAQSTNNNGPAMSEKPNSQNPFSDAAMLSEKTRAPSPPNNPFEEGDGSNHSAKPSLTGSEIANAQVGTAAAVAVGAGGSSPRGPNNVHRVQLDFKPSMEDELELKSGQLVRMLHEYDDGWALCIRMDRTQQGVCPRTCLSKLPVKPRPNGPPPPNGPKGRPMGPPPPGMRGPPPPGGNRMMPRPLTPTGRERSSTASGRTSPTSPLEDARSRSQSVSAASVSTVERPVSPISTAEAVVPARKPLPGQAM